MEIRTKKRHIWKCSGVEKRLEWGETGGRDVGRGLFHQFK